MYAIYVNALDFTRSGYLRSDGNTTPDRTQAREFRTEAGAEHVIKTRGWVLSTSVPASGQKPTAYVAY